ncbi:hypothetical protein BH09ACT4_BH09ACT4_17640 [soil metagenome]
MLQRSADMYEWLGPQRIGSSASLAIVAMIGVGNAAGAEAMRAVEASSGSPTVLGVGVGLMGPHDYSIVGMDDVPDAAFFYPSLSTVRLDFVEVGRAAFELLHHRIQTGESRARRLITPELVPRDSTGELRTD